MAIGWRYVPEIRAFSFQIEPGYVYAVADEDSWYIWNEWGGHVVAFSDSPNIPVETRMSSAQRALYRLGLLKREPRRVSQRTRFLVLKRDGFKCAYCGRGASVVPLEVDHRDSIAGGGGNDLENLITACEDCNQGKSDLPVGASA